MLGLGVVLAAFAVWVPSLSSTGLNAYSFFPLFGLLAWSIMWTHYISGFLVVHYGAERSKPYKTVSEVIVFFCLWLHPGILIYQLWLDNHTWPPASIVNYLGQRNTLFILGAFAAWLAFLSYDILIRLKDRPFWKRNWIWVSVVQAGAMGVIYLHAIKFGRHIQVEWFKLYWAVLGLVLLPIMIYLLWIELPENKLKGRGRSFMKNTKVLVIGGVIVAVLLGTGAYIMAGRDKAENGPSTPKTTQTSTPQSGNSSGITMAQVEASNGKNGARCWVIVDATVYEISGFAQWVDGIHTSSGGQARCGKDLSDVVDQAPHGRSVLRLLTVVGTYQK